MGIACYTLGFVIVRCVAIDVVRSTARSAALTWGKHYRAGSVIVRYEAMQLFAGCKHDEEVPLSTKEPCTVTRVSGSKQSKRGSVKTQQNIQ